VADFPDVEQALCDLLEQFAPTFTVTGNDLDPPAILVQKMPSPGTDRLGLFDTTIVEVQCLGVERPASVVLNNQVRGVLAGARLVDSTQGLLDTITESSSPSQIPYEDEDIRRVTSVWVVTARQK
jgi:hypothetical protein